MLYNVSYNEPTVTRKVDQQVGKPFGFLERFKMRGVGSPKLFVSSSSQDINNLFALDSYINTCNIEIRPRGIILRFRSILETYALPIPFHQLVVYKGKPDEYSIYQGQYFVKVKGSKSSVAKFIKRILEAKTNAVVQSEMPF
ncbi:hypothetical protein OAL15_03840 [Flavobacteriales bacterium]|nr:hypothetical protein [Flavobacteriales bacterium]